MKDMQQPIVPDSQRWHHKPKGKKGPCPICGATQPRLKAQHRRTEEGRYEKIFKVSFGGDSSIEYIK